MRKSSDSAGLMRKLGSGSTVVRVALVGSVMQLRDALLRTIRECDRGSVTGAVGMKGSGQVHHNLDSKIRSGTTRWVRGACRCVRS